MGDLEIRLARNEVEVAAAQALRYRVFYQELSAKADAETASTGRDADRFDTVCDHLLVIKNDAPAADDIRTDDGVLVGTYRLLRQDVAKKHFGFYTQSEFDLAPLLQRKPELNFLELGRSCVKQDYRNKAIIDLLWQGCWDYVRANGIDVMVGCASFAGADPQEHAEALSFLHHNCSVDQDWHVAAHPHRRVDMNMMPKDAIDQKRALVGLPPLIKGYLRLGCMIGDGAVVDEQFNTTDVLIVLPVSKINPRFFERFGKPTG